MRNDVSWIWTWVNHKISSEKQFFPCQMSWCDQDSLANNTGHVLLLFSAKFGNFLRISKMKEEPKEKKMKLALLLFCKNLNSWSFLDYLFPFLISFLKQKTLKNQKGNEQRKSYSIFNYEILCCFLWNEIFIFFVWHKQMILLSLFIGIVKNMFKGFYFLEDIIFFCEYKNSKL